MDQTPLDNAPKMTGFEPATGARSGLYRAATSLDRVGLKLANDHALCDIFRPLPLAARSRSLVP